jgi:hypothetical protein
MSTRTSIYTKVKTENREPGEGEGTLESRVASWRLKLRFIHHPNRIDELCKSEPLGETFGLCGAHREESPAKNHRYTETLTNIINVGIVFVQMLEMLLGNGSAKTLR